MARDGYLILDSDLHMMEPDDQARSAGSTSVVNRSSWAI